MKIHHSHTPLPDKLESSPTVGDIFKKHGEKFREEHGLHPRQHKVMYDIEHCRCGEFGTHWEICDACGHMGKGYNSCRNRHCPGCNNIARRKWVDARIKDLMPVSYHHCVFTLPHEFNPLCSFNRRVMYNLLFECSSQTLLDFGRNPKRLGATIGFYGSLHTWGGKMWLHPHVHYITTAGGINEAGQWITPKNHKTFLFPVLALSNVFSKPPFAGPEEVIKYIGRYTHRTAISNNRIIAEKDGQIEFWFKDTKKKARWETTSLPVSTFIDRFLYHVLPKHFHRIRYYGFQANGKAGINIETIRQALAATDHQDLQPIQDDGIACPQCKEGHMITILDLDGYGNIVSDNVPDEITQPELEVMFANST
jgi:hypothetical protein